MGLVITDSKKGRTRAITVITKVIEVIEVMFTNWAIFFAKPSPCTLGSLLYDKGPD